MRAFEDPTNEGNSPKYHTGGKCITPGCNNPAGTAWGPWWCYYCNAARMRQILDQLNRLTRKEKTECQL